MLPGGDGHFCKVDFRGNFVISCSRCGCICLSMGCVCVCGEIWHATALQLQPISTNMELPKEIKVFIWWNKPYSFSNSLGIASRCIQGAQTGQRGLMDPGWQHSPAMLCGFQEATNLLLSHPFPVASMDMVLSLLSWPLDTHPAQSEACGTHPPLKDDSVVSKSYMKVVGAGQKSLVTLRDQSLCLALTTSIRKAQMTS